MEHHHRCGRLPQVDGEHGSAQPAQNTVAQGSHLGRGAAAQLWGAGGGHERPHGRATGRPEPGGEGRLLHHHGCFVCGARDDAHYVLFA